MDDSLTPEEDELWVYTQDFYTALDKLIRGMQLYQGKGGLVDRLLSDLMKRTDKMVLRKDSTVKISPIGPICFEKPIFEDGKVAKYIFQMYRDGIRELTFQQGVTEDELREFARICNEDIAAIDDDIVTLMWKAGFQRIQYYAVDSLGEQADTVEMDSDLLEMNDRGIVSEADGEAIQFSASDMRLLKSRDNLNWVQMCTAPIQATPDVLPVIEQIQKLWVSERDYSRFLAIILQVSRRQNKDVPLLMDLFLSMVHAGNIDVVSGLLRSMIELCSKNVSEAHKLLKDLTNAERIVQMKDLFEIHHERLKELFIQMVAVPNFNAEGLIELLQQLPMSDARNSLQEVLLRSSVDMTNFYLQGLRSDDENVVIESIHALGSIDTEGALIALYSCLSHSLSSVRTEALTAINGRYLAGQAKQLGKILKDPDESNRLMALKICASVVDKELGNLILGVMREGAFGRRTMDEQQQFFETLHQYPFPTTFQFLSEILKDKNIVRNRNVTMKQIWVIDVFAKIGTEDAKNILEGLKSNWFLPAEVKQRIKEVL